MHFLCFSWDKIALGEWINQSTTPTHERYPRRRIFFIKKCDAKNREVSRQKMSYLPVFWSDESSLFSSIEGKFFDWQLIFIFLDFSQRGDNSQKLKMRNYFASSDHLQETIFQKFYSKIKQVRLSESPPWSPKIKEDPEF